MTPGAHLLASWLLAEAASLGPRERRLVTVAGVVPDLDGIGVVADAFNAARHRPTFFYDDFHHVLCHNLGFGLITATAVFLLARQKRGTALAAGFLAYHLHLLFDLAGSRGPDGYRWPIQYLPGLELSWAGQWDLNGWQNQSFFALLLLVAMVVAGWRRHSFVEVVSPRLDHAFFQVIARRWPPCP